MRQAARRPILSFEHLEDRSLPATWGVPWPDPGHLTLSFVPDGTMTPDGPSTLFATMASVGQPAVWEAQILKAFQTWAVNANINIGVVPDGGEPLGTVGAVQGDPRFGDIRIAAAATNSGTELATASPFSWTGTTLSGDVVFDSADSFQIGSAGPGYDLFSVTAHEAGHVFGLDHSTEVGSVMNEDYSFKTGLSTGDVANIQALYGARQPDPTDAAHPNNTIATAAPLQQTPSLFTQFSATGDITTLSDADYYKVNVPLLGLVTTVRLHAEGVSLLDPAVTVYDASGHQIASAASTNPLNNDLTLTLLTPLPSTYYIKVTGATQDVFGMGGYQVVVDTLLSKLLPLGPLPQILPTLDLHINDILATATVVAPKTQTDARFDAMYYGVIQASTDVNMYKIQADTFSSASPVNLDVLAWAANGSPLDPRIHVYDQSGNPVAFQVLTNDTGVMSIQVPGVTPGAFYYVSVGARSAGDPNGTGAYELAIDFNQDVLTTYDSLAGGTLAAGAPAAPADTMTVNQAGIYQFALTGNLLAAGSGAVTMTLTDASGNVLLTLSVAAGQPAVTGTTYLAAGTYGIQYAYRPAGGPAAPIQYGLFVMDLDDPIGPAKPPPAGPSGPTGGTTTTTTTTTPTSPPAPQPSSYTYATASPTPMSPSYGYSY